MKLRPIARSKKIEKNRQIPRRIVTSQTPTLVKTPFQLKWKYILLPGAIASSLWLILFLTGMITLGGIPASVFGIFIKDPAAVTAFLVRDNKQLHSRLQQLEVEKTIKAYYRPKIRDEIALDYYIHQIFFDWTGYIGNNYQVTPEGKLILTESGFDELQRELQR